MPITIIGAKPTFKKEVDTHLPFLNVAEFFCDTIQGENFIGYPATFLRLQGCTQFCVFCDSQEVWRFGNPYTFEELFHSMESVDLIRKFRDGQHLVLTGGSPMKQQDNLLLFIKSFIERYGFKPYIEVENECTLMPSSEISCLIDCWNNSPKLANSENILSLRYQPKIIEFLAGLNNSWFKFVVSKEEEWTEIKELFIDTKLIRYDQIVLMPLGATRVELESNREKVLEIAIRENVRFSTREHIIIWDKMTGV